MSLSYRLRNHADSMAPSAGDMSRAGTAIARIQNVLHQRLGNRFSIDRIRPLGSYSKKTSIRNMMDIDIVIYLNNEEPPFNDFKRELEAVADKHLASSRQSPLGIKLRVDGFDVDMLPAANFAHRYGYVGGRDANDAQVENALQFLLSNPHIGSRDRLAYSSSLSEGAVKFERLHSAFSHSISRLAKLWSSTVTIPGFTFGRSSIMEYLGARAAEEEERSGSQDVLSAFRRFLRQIERAHSLDIFWTTFYKERQIPRDVRQQRPLLLDPTNPYNNLLRGGNEHNLMKMGPYASQTLKRLSTAESSSVYSMADIFRPQP